MLQMRIWLFFTVIFAVMLSARPAIVQPVPQNCFVLTFLNVCVLCKDGYELDIDQNICNMVNDTQVNETNSDVTQIKVINSSTSLGSAVSTKPTSDPNCQFKGKDGICSKCYPAFYVNQVTKICETVNPLCKTWNDKGQCLSCFLGYKVLFGICEIILQPVKKYDIRDPNCFKYAEDNSCQQCAFRFYFNKQKICTTVDPDCKTWDSQSGACLSCYPGYDLNGIRCFSQIVHNLITMSTNDPQTQPVNNFVEIPNCSEYNQKNECSKCAFRFFYSNGQCKAVSNLCKSWNTIDGQCKSCYSGYEIFEGKCERKDPFCTIKVKEGCVQCVDRYYLDENSRCQGVSPLCKSYNPLDGNCTQCFDGNSLQQGMCNPA